MYTLNEYQPDEYNYWPYMKLQGGGYSNQLEVDGENFVLLGPLWKQN